MSALLPHIKAFRALAAALDVHAGTEPLESTVPLLFHGLAEALRSAADELEQLTRNGHASLERGDTEGTA